MDLDLAETEHLEAVKLSKLDGRFSDALPHAERALALFEAALGPDHIELVRVLRTLIIIHAQLGATATAVAMAERSFRISETAHGADSVEMVLPLENLSGAYVAAGRPDLAAPVLQRGLALAEKVYGPGDVRACGVLVAMGSLCASFGSDEGTLKTACVLLGEAIRFEKSTDGDDHLLRARALNSLAVAHHKAGKLDDAVAIYTRAEELLEALVGSEHPDLEGVFSNHAEAERARGNSDGAQLLEARARRMRRGSFGVVR